MPRRPRSPKEYYQQTGKFKPGISGETFRKDPAFAGSRRSSKQFGIAAKASKIMRESLAHLLESTPQKNMHNRLSHIVAKMIREKSPDQTASHLNLLPWRSLRGFEFNDQKSLHILLAHAHQLVFNRTKDRAVININGFSSSSAIRSLKEATHLRIMAGLASIDFEKQQKKVDYTASDYLPVYKNNETNVRLSLELFSHAANPVFIALGIVCFQELNGEIYELKNQRFQALQIIEVIHDPKVSKPPENKKDKRSPRPAKRKRL